MISIENAANAITTFASRRNRDLIDEKIEEEDFFETEIPKERRKKRVGTGGMKSKKSTKRKRTKKRRRT